MDARSQATGRLVHGNLRIGVRVIPIDKLVVCQFLRQLTLLSSHFGLVRGRSALRGKLG